MRFAASSQFSDISLKPKEKIFVERKSCSVLTIIPNRLQPAKLQDHSFRRLLTMKCFSYEAFKKHYFINGEIPTQVESQRVATSRKRMELQRVGQILWCHFPMVYNSGIFWKYVVTLLLFYSYSENLLANGNKNYWGCVRLTARCITFIASDELVPVSAQISILRHLKIHWVHILEQMK